MAKRKTAKRAKAKPASKPVARARKQPTAKAKAKPAAKKVLPKKKAPAKKAPAKKAPAKKARDATPRIVGITDTGGMISINLMSDHVVEDAGGHALETGMSDVVSIEVQAEAALEGGDTTRALRLYSGLIFFQRNRLSRIILPPGTYYSGIIDWIVSMWRRT